MDLRSAEKRPGPCSSRVYREWGEEQLFFEYSYDEHNRLIGCERTYYDKDSGDGAAQHIHFRYNDDGSLASLETDSFDPFESYEALWTFRPAGSTLEGKANGSEFAMTYEPDPQFDSFWPQVCDASVEAPGSRLERTELSGQTSRAIHYVYDGPRAPGSRKQLAMSEDGTATTTLITYDQESRLVRLEREDGSGYEHSYDERGLWTSLREFGGNTSPYESRFFYDRAGNIRGSVGLGAPRATSHIFYTYDCW